MPCAYDMDMTDCGALLYSRHNDHAGYGSKAAPASSARSTMAAPPDRSNPASVQEHFVLRSRDTGQPLTGVRYTLMSAAGRELAGETDEHGRTGVVWTDTPDDIQFVLDSTGGADDDPCHYSESSTEDI